MTDEGDIQTNYYRGRPAERQRDIQSTGQSQTRVLFWWELDRVERGDELQREG